MRFSLALLVAAVAVCAVGALASPRVTLFDRSSNSPRAWQVVAPALPADAVTFTVSLTKQNLDKLESAFWRVSDPESPLYQNYMTQEEILAIVAPLAEHREAVLAWLESAGASGAAVADMGDALEVTTTVGVASRLFSATFGRYVHSATGKRVVRANSAVSVPREVAPAVALVVGLSEFPVPVKKIRRDSAAAPGGVTDATIVPETLQALYEVPAAADSAAHSVGVIEFEQQYFTPSDLETFGTQTGLKLAAVASDHVVGTNDPTNPGDEAELDVQWAAAVGQGQTWFWIESGSAWLYTFATHFFSTSSVPEVISISYGWAEDDQCEDGIGAQECQQLGVDSQGFVNAVNAEFQKIGLRGVSILVASGDSGANGRTDGGCTDDHLNPDFPAGSPYVTSVGATQLVDEKTDLANPPPACQSGSGYTCASGGTEQAVSYDIAQFASGGGFSNYAQQPSYQADAVAAYWQSGVAFPPASYFNKSGRGYPDVAALGSSILIYEGGLEEVGGTSCSSPIVAGVVSLLNVAAKAKNGKTLGFLNPLLYKMAAASPDAFTDVTVGDNICTEDGCASTCKGYKCAKGWDPVTGLGTPRYTAMLAYVNSAYAANQQGLASNQ